MPTGVCRNGVSESVLLEAMAILDRLHYSTSIMSEQSVMPREGTVPRWDERELEQSSTQRQWRSQSQTDQQTDERARSPLETPDILCDDRET